MADGVRHHRTLGQQGRRCPHCHKGRVYASGAPGVLVRLTGQAPIGGKVYELEKLRCHLCGKVYSAPPPPEVGPEKYDAESATMIGLCKYGTGLPFNRLENLQASLGIPLPAATQWEIVRETADVLEPAWRELLSQAAQGQILHNDDTTMKVLSLSAMAADPPAADAACPAPADTPVATTGIPADPTAPPSATSVSTSARTPPVVPATAPPAARTTPGPERTGVFTSGIVSLVADHRLA